MIDRQWPPTSLHVIMLESVNIKLDWPLLEHLDKYHHAFFCHTVYGLCPLAVHVLPFISFLLPPLLSPLPTL